MKKVLENAQTLVASGFTAGNSYGEIWIRDVNTFIELSCMVTDPKIVREQLLIFFKFQGKDGNIDEIQPMLKRVIDNDGFYEWYTRDGKPAGSGQFRGSAGVLAKAIEMFYDWAERILMER